VQRARRLRHRDHEAQVEEQLERRRGAMWFVRVATGHPVCHVGAGRREERALPSPTVVSDCGGACIPTDDRETGRPATLGLPVGRHRSIGTPIIEPHSVQDPS
jgi:hypothetical protein